MAVRTALGASGGRLTRQLFTETLVLAVTGGALGLACAAVLLPGVRLMGAARIPRLDQVTLDGWALLVCLGAAMVVAIVCGVAPVLQVRAGRFASALVGTRGGGGDPGRRLRSFFVTAQVALTVVLLSGTGLLLRSFVELTQVDPGFEAEGTLAFGIEMPDAAFTYQERGELFPTLRDAVASVPGVIDVGATAVDPFSGNALANFVAPEENLPDRAADFMPIHWRVVTPGFFEAMGMELIAGRTFEDRDGWEDGLPIVIGASLAEATWGSVDPIGRQLVWGGPQGSRMTVVGVVEDLRDVVLDEEPLPIVYRSHRSVPWAVMTMVARVEGEPAAAISGIRARMREVAPGLPLGEFRSLETNLSWAVAEPRFNLQLLSGFAVLGLLMAVIGVYGLTAFDVRRRLPEIGIRLSLGASTQQIQWQIVRERMTLSLLGVVAGLALASALAGTIRSLLYGVTPGDPLTWVGVTAVIILSALVATVLPARRATQVDPVIVLNAGE
jgi:predicted permease